MTEGSRTPSRSRRSYPNLHNLSLAPLSAKYPIDASAPPSPDEPTARAPRTSYIAQKSAPTTPGILSLSQSRSNSRNGSGRHLTKPIYAYDGYFLISDNPVKDVGDIPKAKSTSTLHAGVSFADDPTSITKRHHVRKATAPLPLRTPLARHHTNSADDEWWHRAGLAIAGSTRDSKGQGWLVRRDSSTSLVPHDDPDPGATTTHMALLSGSHLSTAARNDMHIPTFSPRTPRTQSLHPSRVPSRVHSARPSRRGSRVHSRADLASTSPLSAHRPSIDTPLPSWDDAFLEPDFVEAQDDSDGDEAEIARLARERRLGLGSWLDRMIGWTLFSVDEDGEASGSESDDGDDDDDDGGGRGGGPGAFLLPQNMTREEFRLRREVEAKRRKMEREAIVAAAAVKGGDVGTGEGLGQMDDAGGWQDAAWLLSVASKALF
ncbi:hypothetical protein BDU57DRAFT_584935 [Ampelomyces quisqualis]|uniref:Uncharacterized protein n=1 Tax=Ampelomyces quisqualis TaxID=50730 RepID=A0A6A5R490_AMPQU|nr:hypothetical protein BDU57DRAFT_584935 [Ampelomyces quisqualis]